MPTDDGVRLHKRQRVEGTWQQTIQGNKDQAIRGIENRSLRQMPSLDVKLMTRIRISACSEARDRNNKASIDQTRLQASLIRHKHCAIWPHLPVGLDFRQGHL